MYGTIHKSNNRNGIRISDHDGNDFTSNKLEIMI